MTENRTITPLLTSTLMEEPTSAAEVTVRALERQLHSDQRVATPADVVRTIDTLLERLYLLRGEAVAKNRRRTDEAMQRSSKLLAGDASSDHEATR